MNYYKLSEEVFDYEMLFPETYKAIRNLALYDKKVKRTINKEYPEFWKAYLSKFESD